MSIGGCGGGMVSFWDSLKKQKCFICTYTRFADFYLVLGDPYRSCLSPEVIKICKYLLGFQQVPTCFVESKTKLPEKAEHLLFKLINPGLKQPEADYFSLSLRSWSRRVTGSTRCSISYLRNKVHFSALVGLPKRYLFGLTFSVLTTGLVRAFV